MIKIANLLNFSIFGIVNNIWNVCNFMDKKYHSCPSVILRILKPILIHERSRAKQKCIFLTTPKNSHAKVQFWMLEAKRNFFLGQKFHSYNSALQVKMNRFLKTKFSSTLFQRPVKWFMIQLINYVSKVPFQVACVYNFLFKFQLQKSWQRPLCVANNFAQWKICTLKKVWIFVPKIS